MMQVETDKIITRDSLKLHFVSWVPDRPSIATLTFVHGYGEHIDRYSHVFQKFVEAGIRVNTFDQRGHGKSEGVRGHTPSLDHSIADISLLVAKADPNLPHFIYGHSMGAAFALIYAERNEDAFDGIICSAPPIRLAASVPYLKVVSGRFASKLVPTLRVANELDPSALSRDPKVGEAYVNDPHVVKDITLKAGAVILDFTRDVYANVDKLTKPILLIHGTEDKIAHYDTSKEFFEKIPSSDKTFHSLDGWYHEPHNEPEKDEFISFVLDWVLKHIKDKPTTN